MDRIQLDTFVITHHSTAAVNRNWKRRRDSVDRDHHYSTVWSSSCWSTAMDRRRKALVRLMIVAILGLIFSIDGRTGVGMVEASVASSQGRSVVYGRGGGRGGGGGAGGGGRGGGRQSVWRWRRTMKTTIPDEQETRIMNFLAGGGGGGGGSPIKHPSPMRRWGNGEGNPLLFLGHDGQPPPSASQFLQSSDPIQDERRNSNAFGNTRHRPISTFFNPPQSFWNLDGPRRHRSLTRNPESRSSYLALDENPFSSFRDAGGERQQLMSIGARRILVDPREEGEAWRRPTQKFWRRLRSLNDKSQIDYMLNAKRQPPPGFHAIRGKRESESNGEEGRQEEEDDEDEEEEDEEEKEADAEELNRWMMHKMAGRTRHEML